MSSEKKIAANRANSLKSTGPKTDAGKSAASRNNTRHGLAGKQVVLASEDPAAYETLRADLMRAYRPANAAESILVEEIAQNFWRLQRARNIEAETYNLGAGASDPVIAYGVSEDRIDRIRRYMASIERAWHRAMQQLERMQSIRAKQPKLAEESEEEPEEATLPEAPQSTQPLPFESQRLFVVPGEHSESTRADREQPPGH